MDFATLIGIAEVLGLVAQAIYTQEWGLNAFYDLAGLLTVFGGTFAALFVNYPLAQVFRVLKIASKVVFVKVSNPTEIIEELISYARLARREGGLALQEHAKNIKNSFLKRGIQLIIDGATRDHIEAELNTEITFMQKRHRAGQEIFVALGTYSPAWGIIGTIMGMILMLRNLEDQSQITAGMAIALTCAFYGIFAAYLIFLPIAGKLKGRSDEEVLIKQVVIQGILSIQAGESTLTMEDKLKAYLEPALRQRITGKQREATAPSAPEEEIMPDLRRNKGKRI